MLPARSYAVLAAVLLILAGLGQVAILARYDRRVSMNTSWRTGLRYLANWRTSLQYIVVDDRIFFRTAAVTPYGTSVPKQASQTVRPSQRDPALWPFATNSVWNYPIGSNAKYTTAALGNGQTWAQIAASGKYVFPQGPNFSVSVVIGQSTDPLQTICASADVMKFYKSQSFPRHFPSTIYIPSGEAETSIITPDHLTSIDVYGLRHTESFSSVGYTCPGGGWYNSAANPANGGGISINVDLKGPGIWVGPGGIAGSESSGTGGIATCSGDEATPTNKIGVVCGGAITYWSQEPAGKYPRLAGLIRRGELQNGIHHAMVMTLFNNVGGPSEFNQNAPGGRCYVWPAALCDGNYQKNYGRSGPLFMGGLVAIPATVNITAHTFDTTAGKNLALAFQQYGAYVGDSGGANVVQQESAAALNDPQPTANDDIWITQNLAVVTNSHHSNGAAPQGGYKLEGGDGTINTALLAPAFAPAYGGGHGRTSYFVPFIPGNPWARLTQVSLQR